MIQAGDSDILTLEAVEALVGYWRGMKTYTRVSMATPISMLEALLYKQPLRSPVINKFLSARPCKLSALD